MAVSPRSLPRVRGLSAGYALFHYLYSRWYYKKAIRDNESAPDKPEIIGVRNASGKYKLDSGVYTGWTNTIDTTSRPGHIKIELTNGSGDTDILLGYTLRGNAVLRFGGNNGYKHDSFNDYDDIIKNGERVFEFGNNFIVTKNQLEQLADYYWKLMRRKKHMYVITLSGTRYWFEPGEWYTLQVGGAGQVEYIDATVECYDVQTERGADGVGQTVIAFREVEQNWTFDSNAVARFIACGSPQAIPKTDGVVSVASSDYLGAADYYCDGTDDEDEINAAITLADDLYQGGEVRLLGTTFTTADKVNLKSNIIFNMNGATISSTSAVGNAIDLLNVTNCSVLDGIIVQTDNTVITQFYGILVTNSSYCTIRGMKFLDCLLGVGLSSTASNHILVDGNKFVGNRISGVISAVGGATISNNYFTMTGGSGTYYGGAGVEAQGICEVYNNSFDGLPRWGIRVNGIDGYVSSNRINECGYARLETTPYPGIEATALSTDSMISGNMATRNSNLISYYACEDGSNPPQVDGNTTSNATWARSDEQEYAGSYSYKVIITSTGSVGYCAFVDNFTTTDQHGFVDGVTYRISCRVYVPGTGGPLPAEVSLKASYYDGGWTGEQTDSPAGTNAWEELTFDITAGASMTGFRTYIAIDGAASDGEYIYIDNVRIVPLGLGNDHDTNFSDSGTGTVVSGNSWQ